MVDIVFQREVSILISSRLTEQFITRGVYANALFKQCQCIIAQGLKEWAVHTSQKTTYISSCPFFSLFLEQKWSRLACVSVCIGSGSAQGHGWNWIKHDWHLVISERTGREWEGKWKISPLLICQCGHEGGKCICEHSGAWTYISGCSSVSWNDFKLQ